MKIKQIIAVAAMLISTTAFAQSPEGGERNHSLEKGGWNSVYISYNMLKYSKQMFAYNKAYNGLSIGYDRAIGLSSKLPFYIEFGGAFQYAGQSVDNYDFDDDDSNATANILSVKVPVSVLYRWHIPNSNWSVIPKAGLDGRLNVIGKGKLTYNDEEWSSDKRITEKYDMFKGEGKDSDNGLYGCGEKCKRFQFGLHVGVNMEYDSIILGISYTTDINAFCKLLDAHFRTLAITIGCRF